MIGLIIGHSIATTGHPFLPFLKWITTADDDDDDDDDVLFMANGQSFNFRYRLPSQYTRLVWHGSLNVERGLWGCIQLR